jgi:ribonuclease HII
MLSPKLELDLLKEGYPEIIGIDEAGRGAWAGPVAVGYFRYKAGDLSVSKVNDSKKLSPEVREELSKQLISRGGVMMRDSKYIDENGISTAIEDSIAEIMSMFPQSYFLIDGQFSRKFVGAYKLVIKGDAQIYTIAAASIIAKHSRDTFLAELDKQYPDYGLASHKGYGTARHQSALAIKGPSSIHRFTYKPVAVAAKLV